MRDEFRCASCRNVKPVRFIVIQKPRQPICTECKIKVDNAHNAEKLNPNDSIRIPNSITEGKERSAIRSKLEDYLENKRIEEINKEYDFGY